MGPFAEAGNGETATNNIHVCISEIAFQAHEHFKVADCFAMDGMFPLTGLGLSQETLPLDSQSGFLLYCICCYPSLLNALGSSPPTWNFMLCLFSLMVALISCFPWVSTDCSRILLECKDKFQVRIPVACYYYGCKVKSLLSLFRLVHEQTKKLPAAPASLLHPGQRTLF